MEIMHDHLYLYSKNPFDNNYQLINIVESFIKYISFLLNKKKLLAINKNLNIIVEVLNN